MNNVGDQRINDQRVFGPEIKNQNTDLINQDLSFDTTTGGLTLLDGTSTNKVLSPLTKIYQPDSVSLGRFDIDSC